MQLTYMDRESINDNGNNEDTMIMSWWCHWVTFSCVVFSHHCRLLLLWSRSPQAVSLLCPQPSWQYPSLLHYSAMATLLGPTSCTVSCDCQLSSQFSDNLHCSTKPVSNRNSEHIHFYWYIYIQLHKNRSTINYWVMLDCWCNVQTI